MPNPVLFQNIRSLCPGKSIFDLSYDKKLTCDMGQLIPVLCEEMVPGDHFRIGNQVVVRFQPMLAPILHEVNVYVHYYFVPYRLLWDGFEDFITGGIDGQNDGVLPRWIPSSAGARAIGSLWDYMGFPTDVDPIGFYPIDFPKRAYNFVYNSYYRDETLQSELDINNNEALQVRNWEKDYFASALPWQQRGIAPSLPISGIVHALFPNAHIVANAPTTPAPLAVNAVAGDPRIYVNSTPGAQNLRDMLNDNSINLAGATTFNVSDLRLAFQVQKWLERNARCGARYTEFLRGHYGVSPRDDRLQRPEYIGGSKSPVIVSEVLQTSATGTTAQGNMAGHGLTADATHAGSYHAQEFGLILGLMSVMPRTAYQQGINRQWTRKTRYDFYSPEFANLSEQAILHGEIYAQADTAANNTIFGYQGRYDEMRTKSSMVCGLLRTDLQYWHLGRKFIAKPELNNEFLGCRPRKDIFSVPSQPGLIVNVRNMLIASRPMPIQSEPGLIDHN